MKANELRCGNKVSLYGSETFVHPTDFKKWLKSNHEWELEAFKPIPLTEEWLIKFGFEKVKEEFNDFQNDSFYHWENSKCWIYLIEDGFELELITGDERFNLCRTYKYVHQLQNLYFALTGTELSCNY